MRASKDDRRRSIAGASASATLANVAASPKAAIFLTLVGALALGCGRSPTPLYPTLAGSIGMPHRGVLTGAVEMPPEGPGYRFLRDNDRHFAIPRFGDVLRRAAEHVERARPGAVLVIGDLSIASGGRLLPHLSHRSGRDVDLLLYATTLDGAPVASPEFIHYGADGLAWDAKGKRYLRLDVERQWLLVKWLLEDEAARVQWIFVHRNVKVLLLEWAHALGEPLETLYRATQVMAQPHPGGPHDDHLHVRTACSDEELTLGCEHSGPLRAWLSPAVPSFAPIAPSDEVLALELMQPLESTGVFAASVPESAGAPSTTRSAP